MAAEADSQDILDDLADLHATLLLKPSAEVGPCMHAWHLSITWLLRYMAHRAVHVAQAACWCQKVFCYAPASMEDNKLLQALPAIEQELISGQLGLISLHVSNNLIEGGTGCHEWEAGFTLAQYVLSNASHFKGKPQGVT